MNKNMTSYPKSGCIDRDSPSPGIDRRCPRERNCKNEFLLISAIYRNVSITQDGPNLLFFSFTTLVFFGKD